MNNEKLEKIRDYVAEARQKSDIRPGKESLPELSCELFGEFFNLVERQLVNAEEGFGAWSELENSEILEGAFRYVTEGKRG